MQPLNVNPDRYLNLLMQQGDYFWFPDILLGNPAKLYTQKTNTKKKQQYP